MKRRTFLIASAGIVGGTTALVVGWGILPARQRLTLSHAQPLDGRSAALNGWVRIGIDGLVTVAMPRSEMGQGVHTALPMLLADELDAAWDSVRIEEAPADKIFGNVAMLVDGLPFQPDDNGVLRRTASWMTAKVARELGMAITGGSSSVRDAWLPMREAGASARAMLVAEAARRWSVGAAQCTTDSGVVNGPGGQHASYAELITNWTDGTSLPLPEHVVLKRPDQFRLIGSEVARLDAPSKSNGSAVFGIDVHLPGMAYAAIAMAPAIGGDVESFDANAARRITGVVDAFRLPPLQGQSAAVVVIAKSYWVARKGLAALAVRWSAGPHSTLTSVVLDHARRAALDIETGTAFRNSGDIRALAGPNTPVNPRRVDAEYSAPYLAHATMEPMNCTALVDESSGRLLVTVWAPTQVPSIAITIAARIANVPQDDVTMHVTYMGGGFGRRLEVDYIAQAVAVAMRQRGRAVKLIWSREEDVAHDYYRPAAVARFSALFDENRRVTTLAAKIACDAITPAVIGRDWPRLAADSPDKTTVEGSFDMAYEIPNQRVANVLVKAPVNIGYWRSVGHSYNAFFKESFIDELAHAAGKDGYQFRRSMLLAHDRHLRVLDLAAERHGWDTPAEPVVVDIDGVPSAPLLVGRGIALHQSFGSVVAEIADVTVLDGTIRVHRVTCVVDCGTPVNPNIIRQQMESGIVFGMSAALFGQITIAGGHVEQSNFSDYPIVRMHQSPKIEVHIMPSAEVPSGVGEPGTAPIAPAIANAIFALTGQRLRSLPLRLA